MSTHTDTLLDVARDMTADLDQRDETLVRLARIIAPLTLAEVESEATNPLLVELFHAAGFKGSRASRSNWHAAAVVIAAYPLARGEDDGTGNRVTDAWRKVKSTASITGARKALPGMADDLASEDTFVVIGSGDNARAESVDTQGNAYRWLVDQHNILAGAKASKAGKAGKADKGDGADKGNAARSQDALKADFLAIWARMDKATQESAMTVIRSEFTASRPGWLLGVSA